MRPPTRILLLPVAFALAACTPQRGPDNAPDADTSTPARSQPPPAAEAGSDDRAVPGATHGGAVPADKRIPPRFQGRWAADSAACTQPAHASALELDLGRVAFHESEGPVVRAGVSGDTLTVTATLMGEGETRDATYRFRISDDGRTLTDLDHGLVRQRCTGARP